MDFAQKVLVLQTALIAISAIAAVVVLQRNRIDSRRNALGALLAKQHSDPRWLDAVACLEPYLRKVRQIDPVATWVDPEERRHLMFLLDSQEQIAIQLYFGSIDEQLYKAFAYTNYIAVWDALLPLAMHARAFTGRAKLFEYYEFMVNEWRHAPPPAAQLTALGSVSSVGLSEVPSCKLMMTTYVPRITFRCPLEGGVLGQHYWPPFGGTYEMRLKALSGSHVCAVGRRSFCSPNCASYDARRSGGDERMLSRSACDVAPVFPTPPYSQ